MTHGAIFGATAEAHPRGLADDQGALVAHRPGSYARQIGHDPQAALPRRPDSALLAPPDGQRLDLAVQTFALLADRTRLNIVWHLRNAELSVNEIANRVEKSPATVSQHLSKLRLAGIVGTRRDGNFIYYSLADNHIAEVVEDALYHADHLNLGGDGSADNANRS